MENIKVTFGGNPVTLLGNQIKVGDKAPNFSATDTSLKDVSLSDFDGKLKLISIFPSVDTSVCSIQNHKFNSQAAEFGDKVAFIAISNDLPFALKRFCGAEGINNLTTLSDHKNVEFGLKYGYLISELRLLARGVVVLDKENVVKYVEFVPEIATEPDYDKAIEALKKVL